MPDSTYTFAVTSDRPDGNGLHAALHSWDLARYLLNPVVLFNHERHLPPIGRAANLVIRASQMFADITFADSPLAHEIEQLVKDQFILGASVGFKPTQLEVRRDHTGHPVGLNSLAQELTEISIVTVPAHFDTLRVAMLESHDIELAAYADTLDILHGAVPSPIEQEPPQDYVQTPIAQTVQALADFNANLRG